MTVYNFIANPLTVGSPQFPAVLRPTIIASYTTPTEPWPHLPTISVQIAEALAILRRALAALALTVSGRQRGRFASDFRRSVGDVEADGEAMITGARLGPPLLACFDAARAAGAGFSEFHQLLVSLNAEQPKSLPAIATAHLAQRLALGQLATIALATEFVSRQDADAMLKRIAAAFEPAEEDAADESDPATYRALVAMRAAVIRDLVDRGRLLPRHISYTFAAPKPTLWLAHRLYADAGRAEELAAENKVVHPAFAPPDGIYLSR